MVDGIIIGTLMIVCFLLGYNVRLKVEAKEPIKIPTITKIINEHKIEKAKTEAELKEMERLEELNNDAKAIDEY